VERRACDPVSLSKGNTEGLYQMKWDGWMAGFPVPGKYWFRQIYDLSPEYLGGCCRETLQNRSVSYTVKDGFLVRITMKSDARAQPHSQSHALWKRWFFHHHR
jgi:hypothetical protein